MMSFDKDRPPSPPSSLKSFDADTLPPIERTLTCQSRIPSPTEFAFDWVLKILAVVSAILFGIWAPVSYRLQDLGNKSNDVSQAQLVKKIEGMGRELAELKRMTERVGLLRAWEFCAGPGREGVKACKRLAEEGDMEDLIGELVEGRKEKERVSTTRPFAASVAATSIISREVTSALPTRVPDDNKYPHDELGEYPQMSSTAVSPTASQCGTHAVTTPVPCSIHSPLSALSGSMAWNVNLIFLGLLFAGLVLALMVQRQRKGKRKGENRVNDHGECRLLAYKLESDFAS